MIIDGQQRLTTLSILIKALYDTIPNKKNKLINDAIEALLCDTFSFFDSPFFYIRNILTLCFTRRNVSLVTQGAFFGISRN